MKFESKFGIGEVVLTKMPNTERRNQKGTVYGDDIMKVVGILFSEDGTINYSCRHTGGYIINLMECELEGDSSFNQENGYPVIDEQV